MLKLGDVRANKASRARSTKSGSSSGLTRSGDDVSISGGARALSKLSALPDVRTEVVNRVSAEVNDPDYDIDAKLADALDRLFGGGFTL